MGSYLLAFVVGELHKKTARTSSGVEVNVWATPAQSEETLDFALDIATRSIDFYDKYFHPLANLGQRRGRIVDHMDRAPKKIGRAHV